MIVSYACISCSVLRRSRAFVFACRRSLLSPAYKSDHVATTLFSVDEFSSRGKAHFIAKVQQNLADGSFLSSVDVDIASCCITDPVQLPIVKQFLYRLRHSAETTSMLASTHHSFILQCLKFNQHDLLMEVLSDTLNYGVFPDHFSYNLLMDHFMTTGNHADAAKLAVLFMLSEDYSNPLTIRLAVVSCLKWLENRQDEPWKNYAPQVDEDAVPADSDDLYFKVPYLKNECFDDHFDLEDGLKAVGKTLSWLAPLIPQASVSTSAELVGLFFWGKFEKANELIDRVEKENLNMVSNILELVDVEKHEVEAARECQTRILTLMQSELAIKVDQLGSFLEEKLFAEKYAFETQDVKSLTEAIEDWRNVRRVKFEKQKAYLDGKASVNELTNQESELKQKLAVLTFFERQSELERSVHPERVKYENELKERLANKDQVPTDDEYIVPDVKRRGPVEKQFYDWMK